jgi:putative membrane protein insertion efficiency factor
MKRGALWLLGWYRQYRAVRPDACRFDPTCSAYAETAITTHGVGKGLYLSTRRVMRCHPLGGKGYDPVPAPTLK